MFENKDKIILVMEYADGGELYDYINNNRLSERDARRIFRQIVSAIKYCHQVSIMGNQFNGSLQLRYQSLCLMC